ncbi:hypothetical protein FQR65_LT08351 [Abscondita terminalis]|nr:hypothetical protein FQR65_LT08351 [Abscondita terminalis]
MCRGRFERDAINSRLVADDLEDDLGNAKPIQKFPEIINKQFEFQDLEGAIIPPDFYQTFLNISIVGVTICIHVIENDTTFQELPSTSKKRQLESLSSVSSAPSTISNVSNYFSSYSESSYQISPLPVPDFESSQSLHTTSCSFDEDSEEIPLTLKNSSKRAKTASYPYNNVSCEELKKVILVHPGGKEIICYYKENKTLDDKNRKKLVNVFVEHMLKFMPPNVLPCTQTKIDYAKCAVTLFPKLKDPTSKYGFEAFFDPSTKKGWITNRLRSIFRDTTSERTVIENKENCLPVTDLSKIEESIAFLKFSTVEQKQEIFDKTRETFEYRNKNRDNITKIFPRFLDIEGLISFEFKLMFPNAKDDFINDFFKYIPAIRQMYNTTALNIDPNLLKESLEVEDNDEWNVTTKAVIILIHLLPPTSSKKTKRVSSATAVEKLLKFQNNQIPLKDILNDKPSLQPFILAVGTSKAAISSYYVVFDNHMINSPENNILSALDLSSFLSCSGFHIDKLATMTDINKRNSFTSTRLSSSNFFNRLLANNNISSVPSPIRYYNTLYDNPNQSPDYTSVRKTRHLRGRYRKNSSKAQASPSEPRVPTGRIDTYVFPPIDEEILTMSRYQRSPEKNKPQQRNKPYHCQRQDVARKAYLANTVVRAKAESMSSNRVHNYSVTFRILERFKFTPLPIDDTLRLTFSSDTKDMNCEIEGPGRPHDLVKAQIQQSKEYYLFLNSHGMHNYTVVGMPVLRKKRNNNKKNRDLEQIRRVTNKNFGKLFH